MKRVSIHPNYNLEKLLELQEKGLFEKQDFRARAKAAYRAERKTSREDYSRTNQEQRRIFLDLLTEKAHQGEVVEDIDLAPRSKTAYQRSLIRETELLKITSKKELAIFLDLLEKKVEQTGYLNDTRWLEIAKEVYIQDRDFYLKQQTAQELASLQEAKEKIDLGCEALSKAIAKDDLGIDLQQAYSLLIEGSHDLLSLAEKYLYPKQNWLQKKLSQKIPIIDFNQTRRKERIKTIRYILDYIQQLITLEQANQNEIHLRRLQSYLRELTIETNYLFGWLAKKIAKLQLKIPSKTIEDVSSASQSEE
ncbi:MAG: hypothetical protein QNJ55_36730 [Xenococcus sp. MO_188.B8]|nr:hypothetical protein [Xenococcus sp. MO_188.B8]